MFKSSEDKAAIVTGGGSGIGRSAAHAYAAAGARIVSTSLAAVPLIAALAGCATGAGAPHEHHSTSEDSNRAMCDMHGKMMSAKTPEEREAMMKEHMKGMSVEEKQKKMEAMRNKCKKS